MVAKPAQCLIGWNFVKANCCNLKMMFYEHIDTPKGTKCQQAKMGGGS